MSEEVLTTKPEGEPKTVDYEAEFKRLKATNERLLEESKKNKEKYRTVESELERISEESTGKEKDVNKILSEKEKKLEKIANENKKLKAETLNSRIRASVSRFAEDVVDIDDLLNQPKFSDILKRGIDVDELSVDDDVIKEYVETVLKAKPHFRKQAEATTMMTKKPGFSTSNNKSVEQMTAKELEELAYQLYGKK